MTTATIPNAPTTLAPVRKPMAAARVAFRSLLLRDLVVLRKTLKEFIPRTILQPFLLVFVFTYVFPKIGQGVGGTEAAAGFSTLLVAGVVGIAILFQGIQSVALPLVQEFGYTREIEDRVLAPLPVWLVAIEKIDLGRAAGPDRRAARVPDRRHRAGDAGAPRTSTGSVLLTLAPLACFMCGALGLTFGTLFDPRTVPLLFGIIVIPLTFLGCIYYSWSSLEADPLAADPRAGQPARLHQRGLPGRAHDVVAHEPVGGLRRADRVLRAVHLAGHHRVQAPRPELTCGSSPCSRRRPRSCSPWVGETISSA